MAAKETGKTRALRIPLDYFKRPDPLARWKLWLAGIAFLLSLGWAGAVCLRQNSHAAERGPVASVHALWESRCDSCHQPFVPLAQDNILHRLGAGASSNDQLCSNCHAGPAHHAIQSTDKTPSCAGCHRDHQGRDAHLTRSFDSTCTGCHGDLKAAYDKGAKPGDLTIDFNRVTSFDGDHPQFLRVLSNPDPGKLKFNHQLHLTAGLIQNAEARPFTFAQLQDDALRSRYMKLQGAKSPDAAIRLDCKACHQLDAADWITADIANPASNFVNVLPRESTSAAVPGKEATVPPSAGAYMQPISYDAHCKACHPLTVPGLTANKEITVPHRLQPVEVRQFLWGALAEESPAQKPSPTQTPARPLPGNPPGDDAALRRKLHDQSETGMRLLNLDALEAGQKLLFSGKTTCNECHYYDNVGRAGKDFRITPTQVPAIWFVHARFDHHAHRALDCLTCHVEATKSTKSTSVLLPGIETCKSCHAPADGAGKGGARHDCVECHRYHQGDAPVHGLGAWARDPHIRFPKVDEMLEGGPHPR